MTDAAVARNPPAPIVKDLPVRGPLHQRRLAEHLTFACSRCRVAKKSRLVATYDEDWNRLLCNGCYGRLLSIHTLKRGTLPEDERAQAMVSLVERMVGEADAAKALREMRLRDDWETILSPQAARALGTAHVVAGALDSRPHLDWSAAVLCVCKALELEAVTRLLPAQLVEATRLRMDVADRRFAPVARFLARQGPAPSLGQLARFIEDALSPSNAMHPTVDIYLRRVRKMASPGWLLSATGGTAVMKLVASTFRNPAAHSAELDEEDYEACYSAVAGPAGALWQLADATERNHAS